MGDEWHVRFSTNEAGKGWEELCQQAAANTRDAFYAMVKNPRPAPPTSRHHRLRGSLGTHTKGGVAMEQWQIEVTSGGRIWYAIDDEKRTVWVVYASPRHPKETD